MAEKDLGAPNTSGLLPCNLVNQVPYDFCYLRTGKTSDSGWLSARPRKRYVYIRVYEYVCTQFISYPVVCVTSVDQLLHLLDLMIVLTGNKYKKETK